MVASAPPPAPDGPSRGAAPGSHADAPSTAWSVVLSAGAGSQAALAELCERYLGPVYAFFRAAGRSREDAEDLAQDLFARLIASGALASVDPARGRFRAWLLTCARNLLRTEVEKARALKRGGPRRPLPFDPALLESRLAASPEDDPARRFDRAFAEALIARALDALSRELPPRAAEAFALSQAPRALSYREIGERLHMSEAAVAQAVHRARVRLRAIIFEETRATVDRPEDAQEELRELFQAFGPGRGARGGG